MRHLSIIALLLLALIVPACETTPALTMIGTKEIAYEEVHSPVLADKSYSVGLIVPPVTSDATDPSNVVGAAATEMLRNGMRPVSAAQAAGFRAAIRQIDTAEGPALLDRATAKLHESGAEFAVIISELQWSSDMRPTRLFIGDGKAPFREVDPAEFGAWEGPKYAFKSPVLFCTGRVMDVASMEVVATFKTEAPANWSLSSDYRATMLEDDSGWGARTESFNYQGRAWLEPAKRATVERVIAHAVGIVGKTKSEAQAPEPEEPGAPKSDPK